MTAPKPPLEAVLFQVDDDGNPLRQEDEDMLPLDIGSFAIELPEDLRRQMIDDGLDPDAIAAMVTQAFADKAKRQRQ